MPYITREDGERFVIPSYRDVLSAKSKSQLKKDILLLSQSYGEYITMQKKNAMQYEVAFSPDTGYLLGETVWQHFKKPSDMIYCEAIPGVAEVILVIVKDDSVYLDGSFPIDNVSEELVVFLTQQAHFEIYTYGDVPIADSPEDGKFSFDQKSVKSFTMLDEPVFPTLALVQNYKLQLVETVLTAHGIGVLPIKQFVIVLMLLGGGYLFWSSTNKKPEETIIQAIRTNPYEGFIAAMISPLPDKEIATFAMQLNTVLLIPGWAISDVDYKTGNLTAKVKSNGGKVEDLYAWGKKNNINVKLDKDSYKIALQTTLLTDNRSSQINNLEDVIAVTIDRIASIYPGNHLKIAGVQDLQVYKQSMIVLDLDGFAPQFIDLVAKQFKDLPYVVQEIKGTINNGRFKGTITLTVLGN
jgi:hypothetical protein